MGCKYVKEFEFAKENGYTGSTKGYKEGGKVEKAVHKHEKAMHPGEPLTPLKKGGMCSKK